MNVIILGAGRMGLRHAEGIAKVKEIKLITLIDNNPNSIENAKKQFLLNSDYSKFIFYDNIEHLNYENKFEIGIIATTANNRIDLLIRLSDLGCNYVLVEKPIGQSFKQILEFNNKVNELKINCFVNLNMRLNDSFLKVYNDIRLLNQFNGELSISINSGSIGIGANGIHYLDYLLFLFNADDAKIVSAEIQNELITSGRGDKFCDFGGWAVIKFYRNNMYLGKAMLSLSSTSSVFGSWEIIGTHGRIYFNEVEQRRTDLLRDEGSTLPIYRYHGDYLKPMLTDFPSPFLGDLTNKWIKGLLNENISLLPTIEQSLKAHKLLFDWLEFSSEYSDEFPIT
jgi:predicted dehydrogenase